MVGLHRETLTVRASPWVARFAKDKGGRRSSFTPVERLNFGVLMAMTALMLIAPGPLLVSVPATAWFLTLFALTAGLPRLTDGWRSAIWMRSIAAAAVLLSVYESLGHLIGTFSPAPRDQWLLVMERWISGGKWPPLSPLALPVFAVDALSVAYVAYFGLPVVLIGSLIRRRQLGEAQTVLFTLLVAFYIHYAIYFFVPAVGPARTLAVSEALRAQIVAAGGPLSHGLRRIIGSLERTRPDAFPSAHTSVAILVSAFARRYRLRFRWRFYATTIAIVASTVPLGYHYVVDVIAALPIAWLAWQVGRWRRSVSFSPCGFRITP